jgi:hypothetical protein
MAASCRRKSSTDASFQSNAKARGNAGLFLVSRLREQSFTDTAGVAKLSQAFELKAGDIIYSGTPENVGPVVKGDVLLCKLEGLPDMSIRIV